MIYDYKNIPWHLFVRQEDIDKQIKLKELKKKEKALNTLNKKQSVNKTNQFNEENEQLEIDFFSLEPTEINLDN